MSLLDEDILSSEDFNVEYNQSSNGEKITHTTLVDFYWAQDDNQQSSYIINNRYIQDTKNYITIIFSTPRGIRTLTATMARRF